MISQFTGKTVFCFSVFGELMFLQLLQILAIGIL